MSRDDLVIPAREGRGFRVRKGEAFRIVTPQGAQAADFFAYNAESTAEWLSPPHTWVKTRSLRPRQGDVLLSRFRRPMLAFDEDGAGGVHDMLLAACDSFRYEQLGHEGHHASCAENLSLAMRRLGFSVEVTPQPINFFTNTRVGADGALESPPNPVSPGAFVELRALLDLVCVVSSCPFDLKLPDWPINSAEEGPTELVVSFENG